MGSFCSSSTSSSTTVPPQVLAQYQNVINQANSVVANNPFQAYTGPLTAGLNGAQLQAINAFQNIPGESAQLVRDGTAQQNQGFANAENASNYFQQGAAGLNAAQPYYSQAANYARDSAGPLNISQYLNPYTQSVIDTTSANIDRSNAGQQNDLTSRAIMSGNAFGGDRAGVTAAELARNQDLAKNQVIAGLNSQNYSQALSAAQADAARKANTASLLGGLGNSQIQAGLGFGTLGNAAVNQGNVQSNQGNTLANMGLGYQNADLNSYQALLGAGQTQQATEQAALNAAYQQYQNKVAFPYQQTGWLANISTGIGSGSGSTTSGTSTPSLLSMLARGGAVPHRANGGSVTDRFPVAGGPLDLTGSPGESGLIPTVTINQASIAKGPSSSGGNNSNSSPNLFGQIQKGVGNLSSAYNAVQSLGTALDTGAGVAGATGDVLASLAAFADGGSVPYLFPMPYGLGAGNLPGGGRGLIPAIQIGHGSVRGGAGLVPPNPLGNQSSSDRTKDVKNGLSSIDNFFSNNQPSPVGATSAVEDVNNFSGGRGSLYARGGLVGHYDGGGVVDFEDRWAPVDQALSDDVFVPGKVVHPVPDRPVPRQDEVINPNDPFRLDGTYDAGAPLTEAQAAARYRGDDGLGAIATATRNDPEGMPADASGYSPGAPAGGAGLGGIRSQSPQGLAAIPNLSRPDGNAPAPGFLGNMGLTRDTGNAVLSGLAGFLSASGNGGLLQGIGRGIAGAQGSLAEAEAERNAIAQKNFENQLKVNVDQRAAARQDQEFATSGLIPDGKGGLKVNPNYIALKKAETEATDKGKPVAVGRDAYGNVIYGVQREDSKWYNPITGKLLTEDATVAPESSAATGDAYLSTLPTDQAAIVKKIANYEIDPKSLSTKGGHREQLLAAASRYNPDFDAANYGVKYATMKDFKSGKSAQNISSFNTALGHLDTLDKAVDALGNRGSSIWNKLTAPISEQVDPKYQKALKQFQAARAAVADELTRAFRGSGGNVHDIKEWEKTINEADSPEALHAATRAAVELLRSRVESVGDQYNRGMSTNKEAIQLLSPKAQKTISRLMGDGNEKAEVATKADIPTISSKEERDAVPKGGSYIYQGKVYTKQ